VASPAYQIADNVIRASIAALRAISRGTEAVRGESAVVNVARARSRQMAIGVCHEPALIEDVEHNLGAAG
jgi:hypothetical protein